MHNYNNFQCIDIEEFRSDMKLLKRVNKYITTSDESDARKCLNNIIIIFNLFSTAALSLLFCSVEKEKWPHLISYLKHINMFPEDKKIDHVDLSDIHADSDSSNFLIRLTKN